MRRLLLATAILVAAALPAVAQSYPNRPIRLLVAYGPGGSTDIIARLLADKLSPRLGQPVLVENRPGGGTIVATQAVATAAPDGYTVLLVTTNFAINASLHEKLPYDSVADFTPVAQFGEYALVMVANPKFPVATVADLVAYAKANPNKISFASSGNGGTSHLGMEMVKSMAGIQMTHIPYRGNAQAVTDMLSGEIHLMLAGLPPLLQHIKAGTLRAIASTGPRRMANYPDLPTIAEQGIPGYQMLNWVGVMGPKGMPREAVDKLYEAIRQTGEDRDFIARMGQVESEVRVTAPADFAQLIKDDIARYAVPVKASGAKPE